MTEQAHFGINTMNLSRRMTREIGASDGGILVKRRMADEFAEPHHMTLLNCYAIDPYRDEWWRHAIGNGALRKSKKIAL